MKKIIFYIVPFWKAEAMFHMRNGLKKTPAATMAGNKQYLSNQPKYSKTL